MKTISFYNIKGGVAKTTSSLAFAQILHNEYNKRVLVLDIDKQANATKSLDCYDADGLSSADLLTAKGIIIKDVIKRSKYGIDVIPANFNLIKANRDVLLDTYRPQQTRLKVQLNPVWNDYDYCIIDHSIEDNMAAINGLAITDDVLVPMKFDKYALDGMEYAFETIESVKLFNQNIEFKGCFLTMTIRSNLYKEGRQELSAALGEKLFDTGISQTVKVGESTFSKPLLAYAPKCTASQDYKELVKEYLEK